MAEQQLLGLTTGQLPVEEEQCFHWERAAKCMPRAGICAVHGPGQEPTAQHSIGRLPGCRPAVTAYQGRLAPTHLHHGAVLLHKQAVQALDLLRRCLLVSGHLEALHHLQAYTFRKV